METLHLTIDGSQAPALRAPGRGPAIILVHGAGGNATTWESTLPAWAGFDVWCPSLPGRCGTAGPPAQTAAAAAAWLGRFIAAAGIERPIVVGHSFGGAVALELGLAEPNTLAAAVLVSTGGRMRVSPMILAAAAAAVDTGATLPLRFAFAAGTPELIIQDYEQRAAATPPATTLVDWHACDRFDRLASLGELRCRVLVVHGDTDPLTPAKHQAKLAEAIPTAERVELEGVGHMLPWERPAALVQAIRGKLASLI